jgi:antitoxin component YwqK of YwqJK toxin-antitoxin module
VDGHHETSFRRGLRDGQDVLQAETGHVLECRNWSNGSPEGLQVGWYRNGRPRYYRVYRRGLAQGTAYEWYDAPGSPLCRIGRFDRGQETGWQRMFRPDGTLRANYVVTVNATFGLMGTKECLK